MNSLPETILQFGTGRFLRAFADRFIHQANEEGQNVGRVVIVQSTGSDTADQINAASGKYHILVRGLENDAVVDRAEPVNCVSRALSASKQWSELLSLARSPELRYILSNTTEAGYNLDPNDRSDLTPLHSFPAKLLAVLRARFDARQPGLTLIPCELREFQADLLLGIVLQLAQRWNLPAELSTWIRKECVWLNTLVDRIVVGPPKDHALAKHDPLLITAEPFAFWALQEKVGAGPFIQHPAIVRATDIQPYFLRKVRILNAAHTALLIKARPAGYPLVREAMADTALADWLHRLLFEEIVPTLAGRVDSPEDFARQTLERFRNPFLDHKFSDIAQNHESKVAIRLTPTRDEFRAKFGRTPPLLDEVLSGK
jgi:tagaturonate reductase